MSTVSKFGFIWDINLQTTLGWDLKDANLLAFMFVAGMIVGGYLVTLTSKWIRQFPAILISVGSGAILFSVCVFLTSSLRDLWVSAPMLFFVGLTLGGGTMIQPYIAKFFDKSKSAMFFGLTTAMYLVASGLTVGLPMWSLPEDPTWTVGEVRHALVPYAALIAFGIILFASTRFLRKPVRSEAS
jgi:sugar phosphate permease